MLGIGDCLRFLGDATLAGMLVDCGEYPALIDGPGTVVAEIYQAPDEEVIRILDDYEDCHPENVGASLYRREWRPVTGPVPRAWVYVYNRDPRGLPVIPHGDWSRWAGPDAAPR